MPKSASFDVLGTCFHFSAAIAAIASRLGPTLSRANVDPKTLFFSWFYAAQRDFTYSSVSGAYTPIAQVLEHTFRRACMIVDVPAADVSDDDVAAVMAAMTKLDAVPGLKRCFDGLRDAGWDVYGVTNGGAQTSLGYYSRAEIELDEGHLLSCDDVQAAKPDARVYERANERLIASGCEEGERWFVAAHAWDLLAARKAGFKTAYLTLEEHDPVEAVFGKFDVYADSMDELLEKLKNT